jgi:hypothetical protein
MLSRFIHMLVKAYPPPSCHPPFPMITVMSFAVGVANAPAE